MTATPATEAELLRSAAEIAGRTLGELAARAGGTAPAELVHAKGWVGSLIETLLGASAPTAAAPDFLELGIEVKTIPIDSTGRPRESTFVCSARLDELARIRWQGSLVRAKLARVLWVPIEADPSIAIAARRVGSAMLWSPTPEEESVLAHDFEELAAIVAEGFVDAITAHRGTWLQLRPKAKDSKTRTTAVDPEGGRAPTLPRGFYLRRAFTKSLLAKHWAAP